ncbi:TlpA family protein disulfide reductase [Butyrivibrio sp. X503]|uniref:TlpA family protein disulfide reductase n=1 Tax=Butyrivibrio sp. X503 TaxID=2364878 RepID=UPI0011C23FE9|nr:TlpA disulfide reductase family protein [Butyrivibrio sp. X503]
MRKIKELCVVTAMCLSFASLTACGAAAENGDSQEDEVSIEETVDTEVDVEESTETDSEEEVADVGELKELAQGDKAPDFTAELVDGTEFKLSEHENEVVLLNFFASWCPPCMGEMPAFEKLKKDNIEGLSILCVNCMEDKATVDQLVKDEGYTFPIAYDVEGKIGQLYPTEGIPYTLVIKNGVIEKIYLGADGADAQYAEYKSAVEECMK